MNLEEWPNCSVPDCPNKIACRLDSDKCWPHTVGMPLDWYKGMPEEQRGIIRALKEAEWRQRRSA